MYYKKYNKTVMTKSTTTLYIDSIQCCDKADQRYKYANIRVPMGCPWRRHRCNSRQHVFKPLTRDSVGTRAENPLSAGRRGILAVGGRRARGRRRG